MTKKVNIPIEILKGNSFEKVFGNDFMTFFSKSNQFYYLELNSMWKKPIVNEIKIESIKKVQTLDNFIIFLNENGKIFAFDREMKTTRFEKKEKFKSVFSFKNSLILQKSENIFSVFDFDQLIFEENKKTSFLEKSIEFFKTKNSSNLIKNKLFFELNREDFKISIGQEDLLEKMNTIINVQHENISNCENKIIEKNNNPKINHVLNNFFPQLIFSLDKKQQNDNQLSQEKVQNIISFADNNFSNAIQQNTLYKLPSTFYNLSQTIRPEESIFDPYVKNNCLFDPTESLKKDTLENKKFIQSLDESGFNIGQSQIQNTYKETFFKISNEQKYMLSSDFEETEIDKFSENHHNFFQQKCIKMNEKEINNLDNSTFTKIDNNLIKERDIKDFDKEKSRYQSVRTMVQCKKKQIYEESKMAIKKNENDSKVEQKKEISQNKKVKSKSLFKSKTNIHKINFDEKEKRQKSQVSNLLKEKSVKEHSVLLKKGKNTNKSIKMSNANKILSTVEKSKKNQKGEKKNDFSKQFLCKKVNNFLKNYIKSKIRENFIFFKFQTQKRSEMFHKLQKFVVCFDKNLTQNAFSKILRELKRKS